ncbi:hypothetical protein BJF79_44185 [Actinomadura sp. CNU-125]|nr:hypothetical protein BJF79_44185 [Actinomadura sp. CNU-125]
MWALALAVFTGLALLSGQADGFGSGSGSGTAAATAPAPAVVPVAGPVVRPRPGEQIVAAPEDRPELGTGDTGEESRCTVYNEQRDSLKLNRWTSFGLHTVDNSWLLKTRLFISMIASFMFMAAALLWRLLGMLMGFSYTFDMVCRAADPINATVRVLAEYAGWFLIPAWLFVLAAAIRRWSAGGRQGPASAVRLVSVFLAATGLIFFIGDEAAKNESDPTGRYTVPWMAATVQGWFTELSDALADLPAVDQTSQVFYDHDPQSAGTMTCDGLSRTLDEMYAAENEDGFPGSATMQQINRMWEASFIRSWMSAQLGEGTPEHPAPAHAACRVLEANSGVDDLEKMKAFDLSNGDPVGTTTPYMMRGFFINPKGGLQRIAIAWGACMMDADPSQGANGVHTTPQWDQTDTSDKTDACALMLSDAPSDGVPDFLLGSQLEPFYFNGGDELNGKLGDCINVEGKAEACRHLWEHAEAWLGANQVERLTQGLMSLIVAFVFLLALGPMAVGLMLISVALSGLAMLLPLTLLLFAMGLDQGKKLLRLTGAAAAGKFLFTLALSALSLLVDVTYMAINASFDQDVPTPTLFEQVAQGAAPLFALWLFKRFSRIMGLGNIGNMTGALGFAGAAALKAAGGGRTLDMFDQSSGRRVGSAIGGIGVGGRKLGNLDEQSLQRRVLVNRMTGAMAGAAGHAAKRAARPVTDKARHVAESAAAGIGDKADDLWQKTRSGTPAQRAKAYAGLTAALVAGTALAPPTALAAGALVPLTLAAGGGTAAQGTRASPNGRAGSSASPPSPRAAGPRTTAHRGRGTLRACRWRPTGGRPAGRPRTAGATSGRSTTRTGNGPRRPRTPSRC